MTRFAFLIAGSGPAGDPGWDAVYATIGQGTCPVHGGELSPVHAPAGRLAGYCLACGKYWGANLTTTETGWWAGRYPGPEHVLQAPGWTDWGGF